MKRAGVVSAGILAAAFIVGCNPAVVAEEPASIWQVDYDAALKQAADENKYVLVSISGLEWCGWCIALEREVFSKPEFIEYARENLVCVLLDFKRSGRAVHQDYAEQHEALLAKYQVQGFPTVLILNPQGRAIERDGYQRGGAPNYINFIKTVIANDQM